MGVRYPSFTNAISLVYYKAKMDDIHKVINHLILFGETADLGDTSETTSNEVTQGNKKDNTNQNENKNGTFIDSIKNIFTNFFD